MSQDFLTLSIMKILEINTKIRFVPHRKLLVDITETTQLMSCKGRATVCCDIHTNTEPINALCV